LIDKRYGYTGNEKHLSTALALEGVSAVAAANLFNFIGNGLPNARDYILDNGANLTRWE
jgi:cyclase